MITRDGKGNCRALKELGFGDNSIRRLYLPIPKLPDQKDFKKHFC
jgi:hypothetical protein